MTKALQVLGIIALVEAIILMAVGVFLLVALIMGLSSLDDGTPVTPDPVPTIEPYEPVNPYD